MSEEKKHLLTSEDIDSIIRETVNNPELSKEAINEKAGIPPRSSRENRLLTPWIKENTYLVFGEEIEWKSVKSFGLFYAQGDPMRPDLVGTDYRGRPVIVEVKFKFNFPSDRDWLRRDVETRAIGQIILYYYAYRKMCRRTDIPIKVPRFFIVSIDFSYDVDFVCSTLRSKGFDIFHLAIEDILSK